MHSIHQKPDMNLEWKKTMNDHCIKVDLWKLVDILTKLYGGRKRRIVFAMNAIEILRMKIDAIAHCTISKYRSGIENIEKIWNPCERSSHCVTLSAVVATRNPQLCTWIEKSSMSNSCRITSLLEGFRCGQYGLYYATVLNVKYQIWV